MEITQEYVEEENTMCNLGEGIYEEGMEVGARIIKLILAGTTDNAELAAQCKCSENKIVRLRNAMHM